MSRKVVVIGGGVIGTAVARALAGDGHRVTLIDRAERAGTASRAAAGMLLPFAECDEPGLLFDMCSESLALYPNFVRELENESGAQVGLRLNGALAVAFGDDEAAMLERRVAWQKSATSKLQLLTGDDARRLVPTLSREVVAAIDSPLEGSVDNRRLLDALIIAARRRGVVMVEDRVASIEQNGGRASGVILGKGRRIAAEVVVLCAGAWSSSLLGNSSTASRALPVRGQLMRLSTTPLAPERVIVHGHEYLVPIGNDEIIVGGTSEKGSFDVVVRDADRRWLQKTAEKLVPRLGSAAIAEEWAGVRPGTVDGLPVVGEDPDVTNLFHMWGHYRNGILLVPWSAQEITRMIVGLEP